MQKQKSNKQEKEKKPTARGQKKSKEAKNNVSKKSPTRGRSPNSDFFVVGIGASAGGLEALETFFKNMPKENGMGFIVISHLERHHDSMLPDIMQRFTQMEVQQAKDMMKVLPERVYIIPPDKNLAIIGGVLHLMELETDHVITPINHFFRALAEDQKERSIGIVLSGLGTDGTIGIKSIKERLGLVMVQEPSTARYSNMPESAIESGMVDLVLPVAKMAEHLIQYVERGRKHMMEEAGDEEFETPGSLDKVFFFLRSKTGHDFSNYKRNTIIRRIRRRMNLHQIDRLLTYVKYLQENPQEVSALFKELLISVTNFFRDPEAFEYLKNKILPELLEDKPDNYQMRIWVPGVATGEEAYSLAILLKEYMQDTQKIIRTQIFATDIDDEAIDRARAGSYPESIGVDVSPERLKRYFEKEKNTYRIRRDIREMLIFANQNIIKDPPFTKLDLICCRNLLIYLNADLQKKLLPLFQYSLRPGGMLFLGTSESIGQFVDLFDTVNNKWKIFRAKNNGAAHLQFVEFPIGARRERLSRDWEHGTSGPGIAELTKKILLQHVVPPSVVIGKKGEILYIHGRTGKYLEPPPGKTNWNIVDMAREGLKLHLMTDLRKATSLGKTIRREDVAVKTNGDVQHITVTVKPLVDSPEMKDLLVVLFEDVPARKTVSKDKSDMGRGERDQTVLQLQRELKDTKENLQTTIEELETSNEELKSMNEEYQSTNEELKSANEELETSREELQSLNEELNTVNTELQRKIERLSETNQEVEILLDNLQIPTLFLDEQMRIKRYTASITNLINLIKSDSGRPITNITTNFKDETLVEDVETVKNQNHQVDRDIQTRDGRWFLRRIVPFRNQNREREGFIVSYLNIAELKKRSGGGIKK